MDVLFLTMSFLMTTLSPVLQNNSSNASLFIALESSPPAQRTLFGDSPQASGNGSTAETEQKKTRKTRLPFSERMDGANTNSAPKTSNQVKTGQKIESSFRAFLASFKCENTATTSETASRQPPPIKRGQVARLTPEDRINRLRADLEPEKLNFIKAAYANSSSVQNFRHVGEGAFSDVYLLPESKAPSPTVMKVFKDCSTTGGTLRPLQGTVRLYDLASACERQFNTIRGAYKAKEFPIDALDILNIDSLRKDGYITQPYVATMFQPIWEIFLEKIKTFGPKAIITDEEEALLKTIFEVFQQSVKQGISIDFKPDNIGLINTPQMPSRMVIIDTFGLSGSENLEIVPMNRANINEFSQGNQVIKEFLLQALVPKN